MRINGAANDTSYGIYNRIPSAVSFLSGKNVSEQNPDTKDSQEKPEEQSDLSVTRSNATIGDVSVAFGNRDISLVGLGNLGGIQSNVMKQAVNDMQKDSLLHEYQYFVGSGAVSSNLTEPGQEGTVIHKDDDGMVIRNN